MRVETGQTTTNVRLVAGRANLFGCCRRLGGRVADGTDIRIVKVRLGAGVTTYASDWIGCSGWIRGQSMRGGREGRIAGIMTVQAGLVVHICRLGMHGPNCD